jgi:hypothetical protein
MTMMVSKPELAALAYAAWLALYVLVRLATRPWPVRPAGRAAAMRGERPAVVSRLDRQPWTTWHAATVLDLAARGLLRLSADPADPRRMLCQAADPAPAGGLADYEAAVVQHVRSRAGAAGSVPLAALADGPEGHGEFRQNFVRGVSADARQLGLTRKRVSGAAAAVLAVAGAPAAVLAFQAARPIAVNRHALEGYAVAAGLGWLVLVLIPALVLRGGERRSRAGHRALAQWLGWRAALGAAPRTAAEAAAGDRQVAYAAALGAAPAAVAELRGQDGVLWSHYTGTWRQLGMGEIREADHMPGPILLTYCTAVIIAVPLADHALVPDVGLKLAALLLVVPGGLFVGPALWLWARAIRSWRLPARIEFDGEVLSRWTQKETVGSAGNEQTITVHRMWIDDGRSSDAWGLEISGAEYESCPVGTIVHVILKMHGNQEFSVTPVGQPRLAPGRDPGPSPAGFQPWLR